MRITFDRKWELIDVTFERGENHLVFTIAVLEGIIKDAQRAFYQPSNATPGPMATPSPVSRGEAVGYDDLVEPLENYDRTDLANVIRRYRSALRRTTP
jgi:hypothetical protein